MNIDIAYELVSAAHAVVPENPVYRSTPHNEIVRLSHETADLLERAQATIHKAKRLISDARQAICYLAEQQAMPDNSYLDTLRELEEFSGEISNA